MRIILLAAGAGERLWPMSTVHKPKQFLPLFPHPKDPTKTISMIQRVHALLESIGKSDSVSVVTTKELSHWVTDQLGDVPQHILPYRKDTFGSVAFGALDAVRKFKMQPLESFLFLPVDHWTDEQFYRTAFELEPLLNLDRHVIALLGIQPTYPSSSYGYIESDKANYQEYLRVHRFREKPSGKEAKAIFRRALWNAGVFGFNVETAGTIIPFFEVLRGIRIDDRSMDKWFETLSDLPFDREVLEKHSKIFAMRFEGPWEDVGTWDRAMKYIPTRVLGEGGIYECENVHVVNSLRQPVIVAGLDDVAVVATEQGIIVTKKSLAPKMKEFRQVRKEVNVI